MITYLISIQYKYFKYQLMLMSLMMILQKSPLMRTIGLLEKVIKVPIARMIQFTGVAIATTSAPHAFAGATAFTSNTSSPTTANIGEAFDMVFAMTGTPSSVKSWDVQGEIPPGLSIPGLSGRTLNSRVGTITGTPTTAGTYEIMVQAYGSLNREGDTNEKRYTISITVQGESPPLDTVFTATPSSNISLNSGDAVAQFFSISGMAAKSWKVTGTVPPGLTLAGPNGEPLQGNTLNAVSGQITGNATTEGVHDLSLQAYDQIDLGGVTDGKTHTLKITISAVPIPVTTFTASPSSNITSNVGDSITQSFSVSGLNAKSWKVTGTIPPGLTLTGPNGETPQGEILNASSGQITGTATTPGTYIINVVAYDATNLGGITDGKTQTLTITVNAISTDLPVVTYQPTSSVIGSLERVQFFVQAGNHTSVQWLKDGIEIPAAQSETLIIENATSEDAGDYQTRLTNAIGSTLTEVANLRIDDEAEAQLINVSTRGYVGNGEEVLIPGFAFSGVRSKTFLIRAAGPALSELGVSTPLADPIVFLYHGSTPIAHNDNWSDQFDASAIMEAENATGALPFTTGSKDAAMIITLNPGVYTAIASGVGGTNGIALVEVYEVP